MSSEFRAIGCLDDILGNIARIESYAAGLDQHAFERDGLKRDAVERCLERICEAASRLGDRATTLMPNQPWGDIRGMGNRLRHAYDRIDFEIVWDVVQKDLPSLKVAATQVLSRLEGGTGDG